MRLNYERKLGLAIVILLIILLSFMITSLKSEDENLNLQLTTKSHSQFKDEATYFLQLEPDNLGNFKIKVDVFNFNQNSSRIFTVIQEQKKFEIENNFKKYNAFYPNLAYIYYSNKIYPISSNIDEGFNASGTITAIYGKDGFEETQISKQKYDLILPDKIEKNISDFSLLIFTKDENSESNLKKYPFDDIKTVAVFDFPNRTNINILVEIPNELKSYTIEPFIFEENKETGEKKSIELKEIYKGIFTIRSTNKVNHEKNYTRLEIKFKRNITSIENISLYFIILISISILLYYRNHKNKINSIEFISIYITLSSIPLAIYWDNRPSMEGFTTIEIIVSFIIVLLFTCHVLRNKN